MVIQIRKSGGSACPQCGATELLYQPAHNAHLEADLLGHFERRLRWWQWLRRRRHAYFVAEVRRVAAELRQRTITAA